ncbi:MAG: hypothetical protein OXB97_04995, partial [Rhodospirillales bacterium]|nr:hypothetical protein [Rhodospirillales bacterium]
VRAAATVLHWTSLMPHKTALDNTAYPLRIARFDRETIEARVLAVSEHFELTDLLTLRPKKLTDVQCYKIGLARALVRDPGVYLFELPTEEDPVLRRLAISEMKRLRDEFGRTVVYATGAVDDLDDLADWVVVLDEGRRLQMGSPERIVKWPASRRVAKLFGAKLRAARVMGWEQDAVTVRLKDGAIVTIPCESDEVAAGERATLAIWPEHIEREGETVGYPPEHCYLFDERGHLVAGPAGPPPKRKTKGTSKRR